MKFLLFDRNENYISTLKDVTEAKHTEEINGEDTLEITTLDKNIGKDYRIAYKDKLGHWKEFIVREIEETHNKEGLGKTIFCESSFYETLGDYIEDKRPTNSTATGALMVALEPTRWEVGIIDDLGINSTNFYRISAKEAVQKVAETWKGEIRTRIIISGNKITHRYVDLLLKRGNDLGKRFTYTKDLESITKIIHRDDVITALYGYGKGEEVGDGYGRRINFSEINNGKAYVENNEARLIWGRNNPDGSKSHVFGKVEFDDCEDKEELKILTEEKLEELSKMLITYEANVVDLKAYGFEHEGVELGDTVGVIDKEFTPVLRLKARVVKIVRDLLENENIIILGNFLLNTLDNLNEYEDYINNFRDKQGVWDRSQIIDNDGTINAQFLNNLVDELNTKMNSHGGYVYVSEDGKGITTYDKPIDQNPTMAVQILGGAIRIANEKNPDGTFKFRTFITGKDITADLINTGILKGGKVNFDLTNGTLLIGDSVEDFLLLFDGSKLYINGLGIESYASKTYVGQTIANEIIDINQNMEYKIHIGEKPPQMVVGYFLSPNQVLEEIELDKKRKWLDTRGTPILRRWDEEEQDWVACSATSLDELDSEASIMLTTHESTITQHANEIATKVSQVDFDALGNIVSSQGSTITQHANEIATKVSQVDFDALGNIVSSQGSTITQLSGEIITKVEKNGVISAINQSPESVTISASKINLSGYVTFTSLGGLAFKDNVSYSEVTGSKPPTDADNTRTTIDGGLVTTGTLFLQDANDNIKAGITAKGAGDTNVRIWAGDSYGDRGSAPFRVLQSGEVRFGGSRLYPSVIIYPDGTFKAGMGGGSSYYFEVPRNADGVYNQFRPSFSSYAGARWKRDDSNYIYQDPLSFRVVMSTSTRLRLWRYDPPHYSLFIGESGTKGVTLKALCLDTPGLQVRNSNDSTYIPVVASEFIQSSSKIFKENILPAKPALELVKTTPIYEYQYKGEKRRNVGLIAEEAPEEVRADTGTGEGAISLGDSVGLLWKAVQELSDKVDRLTNKEV